MFRSLLITSALAACSRSVDLDGVDQWLDAWSRARACLVEPAEDTATGIALARLEGRTCSLATTVAQQPTSDSPLHDLWRSANADLRSLDVRDLPSKQSPTIEGIDRAALILSLSLGKWPTRLTAPRLRMIAEVPPAGISRPAGDPPWPYPDADRIPASLFVQRGTDRAVWDFYGFHGLEGFVVHSSNDRGATWRSEEMPFGLTRGAWVDNQGGRIWQYVTREDRNTVERIDADGTVNVFPRRFSWRPAQRCHAGRTWRLLHQELMVEGEEDFIEVPQNTDLVACNQQGALLISPDAVLHCNRSCTQVFLRSVNTSGGATLLADGRWLYVASLEGVVAFWVEGSKHASFSRLPDPEDQIVALEMVGGIPMALLGWRHNRVLALPVPLSKVAIPTQP